MTDTTLHDFDLKSDKQAGLIRNAVVASPVIMLLLVFLLPVGLVPFGILLLGFAYYIHRQPHFSINPGVLVFSAFGLVSLVGGLSVLV